MQRSYSVIALSEKYSLETTFECGQRQWRRDSLCLSTKNCRKLCSILLLKRFPFSKHVIKLCVIWWQNVAWWPRRLLSLVCYVVCQAKPQSGIVSVRWANVDAESGLPYDFVLTSSDCELTYVEVKATLSDHKACFEFSHRQLVFANEQGPKFHLYRVYCAGDPARVRLVRVEDLARRLEERQLKLFMAL